MKAILQVGARKCVVGPVTERVLEDVEAARRDALEEVTRKKSEAVRRLAGLRFGRRRLRHTATRIGGLTFCSALLSGGGVS
jgi:hypothetical protein